MYIVCSMDLYKDREDNVTQVKFGTTNPPVFPDEESAIDHAKSITDKYGVEYYVLKVGHKIQIVKQFNVQAI